MIRYFLSKIFESIINKRNRKFHNAKIYPSDNIPSNKKYFKVKYRAKIISIGNLSTGGTGKTPLTIEIINNYLPKDKSVCVIGRNYKTESSKDDVILGVDENGNPTSHAILGDEMYLIQSKTCAIAVSGKTKYINAAVAEKQFHPDVMIIDDGFQHQWIKRDLDIVIIDKNTIEKPYVFPRGRLREPLTSLNRADVIMYPDGCNISSIQKYFKNDVILCEFKIIYDSIYNLFEENQESNNLLNNIKLLPIVGIANPNRFINSLDELHLNFDKNNIKIFDDHHNYGKNDIKSIISLAKKTNSQIITTEKDAVKISLFKQYFLENNISIYVLPIRFKIITNQDKLIKKINTIF